MSYRAIYSDPPWAYRDHKGTRSAERHYSTTSAQWLRALPVTALAGPDCALFLWATFPLIETALALFPYWGFVYKTAAFVWVKRSKSGTAKPGMGHYTRANAEPCLLGIRGRIARQSRAVRQIIETGVEPEVVNAIPGEHSAKPPEVRSRIVELCGDVKRIELFARGELPHGWDSWGFDAANPNLLATEILACA